MWHSQKLFFFATCLGGCAVLFLAALALSVAFYYIPVDANIVQHSCIVQNVDIDARTCCHQQCSGTDTRHCNSICNTCYDVIVDYRFVLNEQPSAHRETAISGTSLGRANSYRDGHPPESPIRCYYHGDNPRETVRLRRDSTALLGGPIAVVVVLTVFSCCLLTATCVAIYKFVKA